MPSSMHGAFLDNYRWLARYNAWFNERLYDACERLPDAERRRDRGAFFGSVHATLNHLLWADKLWLQRFAAQGAAFPALQPGLLALPAGAVHGTLLHEDWPALRVDRRALDAAIEAWVGDMPPEWPATTMAYTNMQGVARKHPAWQALTHFFNHQTHHRGQVTTLLAQAGIDAGMTDLVALADRG
ncbi:MAG: DinB family protein [Ramlibacter sp.]